MTAIFMALKDKLDLTIAVAVGSSIQVSLFCIPVVTLVSPSTVESKHLLTHVPQVAWGMGKPMTLLFDPFESIVLFFAVIIANATMADSRSKWVSFGCASSGSLTHNTAGLRARCLFSCTLSSLSWPGTIPVANLLFLATRSLPSVSIPVFLGAQAIPLFQRSR